MRVYLGSDHAGFELKAHLLAHLAATGHDVVDCGAAVYQDGDDYPPFCISTGQRVVADRGSLGVVIGGSGNGEQIAANKVQGVRAVLVWNQSTARLGRQHNDANVMSLGARETSEQDASHFVDLFLATPFSEGERHRRRIAELAEYEATGTISGYTGVP